MLFEVNPQKDYPISVPNGGRIVLGLAPDKRQQEQVIETGDIVKDPSWRVILSVFGGKFENNEKQGTHEQEYTCI